VQIDWIGDLGYGKQAVRKFVIGVVGGVLIMGACRGAYVSVWVFGDGQSVTSPNLRYKASAVSFVRPTFWGGTEKWSQLFVEDAVGRTLWETRIYSDVSQPWRELGSLSWQRDSSLVVFEIEQTNDARFRLQSAPFPGSPSAEDIADELEAQR
jgi:hypothetical protein